VGPAEVSGINGGCDAIGGQELRKLSALDVWEMLPQVINQPRKPLGEPPMPTFDSGRRKLLRTAVGLAACASVGSRATNVLGATTTSGDNVFPLGNFALEAGTVLPDARIAFKTHGTLNADGGNAILYLTPFPAQHGDIQWMIGPGRALDPEKYFVVVADQLGNGLSSSPSNTAAPFERMRFPTVTIRDDVAAQHRLLTEELGVRRLALVVGFSMGAQQAYQWAVSHPDMVDRIAPFCGTARTTPHNAVFLEGARAALIADAAWMDGEYKTPPSRGLRALGRVWSGWGLSHDFYNNEVYRQLGFTSAVDCVTGFWETRFLNRDANNLLSMLRTWQLNDVGATPGLGGSLKRALTSIKAQASVMASQTDMYFRPADMEAEAALIPHARFRVIPSLWGHLAGAGINSPDSEFISAEIKALLVA
jgi:homoserine O-acetyltransferase/O-succinyltransferase